MNDRTTLRAIYFLAAAASIYSDSFGQSLRKPLQQDDPLVKIMGEVSQLKDPEGVGDAWFFDKAGCMVVTNYHVAFGKTKDKSGRSVLIDKPEVGHQVNFAYNFDSKKEQYMTNVVATVVDFGNYEDGSMPGLRGDLAALRLRPCAGPDFAGPELDRSEDKNPQGVLMTVSTLRNGKKRQIVAEVGCRATLKPPAAGMLATSCETVSGMSGSPLFTQGSDGQFRVVGIAVRHSSFADGRLVGIAIAARVLNRFLDGVAGEGSPPPSVPSALPSKVRS